MSTPYVYRNFSSSYSSEATPLSVLSTVGTFEPDTWTGALRVELWAGALSVELWAGALSVELWTGGLGVVVCDGGDSMNKGSFMVPSIWRRMFSKESMPR